MDQARLQQEYANLASVYDPQRAAIQEQLNALPTQYEPQKAALEQAKINAFRDIGQTAQSRGVSFSGFTPSESARYVGEKYLPALAALGQQQEATRNKLQGALIDINAAQRQAATTNLQNILNREQQQRQFEQQLALSRASAGSGGFSFNFPGAGGAGAGADQSQYQGPRFEKTNTGFNFYDSFGKPITALQYAQASCQGSNIGSYLQSLADQGDPNAQVAVQYAKSNFRNVPVQYKPALEALGIGSAQYKDYSKTVTSGNTLENPNTYSFWNRGRK